MQEIFDLAIIGAGPAGVAAALEAKRLRLKFVVIERGAPGGQLRAASKVTDYPGFPEGISGAGLADLFVRQMNASQVEIISAEVTSIERDNNIFELKFSKGSINARSVIVAIGQRPKRAGLDFELRLEGGRVFYYPEPKSMPHKGKNILVLGGGDAAFDEAISFSEGGAKVTLAVRGYSPKANVRLVEEAAKRGVEVFKNVDLSDICYDGKKFVFNDVGFEYLIICVGKEPDNSILNKLGDKLDGCFLAGDAKRGIDRHVALAVGDGVKAALSAHEYLRRERGDNQQKRA